MPIMYFTCMIFMIYDSSIFMTMNMSCLQESAMFISSHSIYLDLVICTIFCGLRVTLLLITEPSFIWQTPLIEEIKQIMMFVNFFFTLSIHKGIFALSTPSCFDIKMMMLFGHTSEILSRSINLTLVGQKKRYCHLGFVNIRSFQYV